MRILISQKTLFVFLGGWMGFFGGTWPGRSLAANPFACPMKCEGEKTYDRPGTCPVCKMDLVPTGQAVPEPERELRLDLAAPDSLRAGQKAKLRFSLRRIKDNQPVSAAEPASGEGFDLFVASEDLSWFGHKRPRRNEAGKGEGDFVLELTFPHSGNFLLYVDVKPAGYERQVFPLALKVTGGPKPPVAPLKVDGPGERRVGAYRILMKWEPAPGADGESAAGRFVFSLRKGRRTLAVKPFRGAKGFCTVISEDSVFFRRGPVADGETGQLEFQTKVPRAGLYKIWFEFKAAGAVRLASFVLRLP